MPEGVEGEGTVPWVCSCSPAITTSCSAMRLPAARSARMMTSGLSLQSRNTCTLLSSPRTAASINPPTDFAFPGCMSLYIPAPRRARKLPILTIRSRNPHPLQTADLLHQRKWGRFGVQTEAFPSAWPFALIREERISKMATSEPANGKCRCRVSPGRLKPATIGRVGTGQHLPNRFSPPVPCILALRVLGAKSCDRRLPRGGRAEPAHCWPV